MIGKKIYYELLTGDVILIVPEKSGLNSTNTTKEQDFQMYDVLQARNPEQIGIIQLEYDQFQEDFQRAKSVKVDLETNDLLFEFPQRTLSYSYEINSAKQRVSELEQENEDLKQSIAELTTIIAFMQL